MKAARRPADPANLLADFYESVIPTLPDPIACTVGLGLLDDWKPSMPPHVGVFDDSGPGRWPISTRPVLRVTVWAIDRPSARDLAGLCMGLALAHKVTGIANVREPSGILDALDPKNRGLMASFTLRTTVRTLPL